MALRQGPIKVAFVGLGPIVAAVAKQVANRRGFRIVGAVDVDPAKAGRDLGEIAWVPMIASRDPRWAHERLHQSKAVAHSKRLPLLEPENYPFDVRPVSRAALFASQRVTGGAFALAAMRLAFAGGFDLSEPDLIAEAAAATGISVDGVLAASADASLDSALEATAKGLRDRGIIEPPVIRIVSGWFSGFDALAQTSDFAAARASFSARAAEPA